VKEEYIRGQNIERRKENERLEERKERQKEIRNLLGSAKNGGEASDT
jgi:hypothetical protein